MKNITKIVIVVNTLTNNKEEKKMEIRTTKEIQEWIQLPVELDKDMNWVSVDSLIRWLENINDKTAYNNWQIRKSTLIERLRKYTIYDSSFGQELRRKK